MRVVAAPGGPLTGRDALVDLVGPVPRPRGRDLLVRVDAVSVNPVDVKVRGRHSRAKEPRIIGYDAVGTVVAKGPDAQLFTEGHRVFYAGQIDRSGTNAQYHLVNENIVGHAPTSLSAAETAAVPLTAITAYEALFDRLQVTAQSTGVLLVIGAAGGAGSMVVQLAKALTELTVIAVASRPDSRDWVRELGADHVVGRDFAAEVSRIAPDGVDYVFTSFTPGNVAAIASVIRPRGQVVSIDESGGSIDALKSKSVTWHWELMFTRPMTDPADTYQHDLLDHVAALLDEGRIRSTLRVELGPIEAASMREAHEIVETSQTIGKVAVSGWPHEEENLA